MNFCQFGHCCRFSLAEVSRERNNGIQVNIAAASWHIEQDIIYSEKSVVGKKIKFLACWKQN